jgi:hypothetical protein
MLKRPLSSTTLKQTIKTIATGGLTVHSRVPARVVNLRRQNLQPTGSWPTPLVRGPRSVPTTMDLSCRERVQRHQGVQCRVKGRGQVLRVRRRVEHPPQQPSKTWTMTTPAQNGGSCPNTGPAPTYECPATNPCPADCSGGTWNYTCPTNCGYVGGNVTATRTGYTPAVGTGSCTTTRSQSCPAQPSCPEPDFVDIIFTPIDVITTPVSSGGCTIM